MCVTRKSLGKRGFTIPEVIVAASIMIILCVGTLTVFSYVVRINRGNALRMQALSVLQAKVEHYRALKFVPDTTGRAPELAAGTHALTPVTTPDGRTFTVSAEVTNVDFSGAPDEANSVFKTITITAIPEVAETEGWLQDLQTHVTIQRVRSN